MNKIMARQYHRAKEEGRLCSNCQWMISIENWNKGYRLCPGCYDAMKGVKTMPRWGTYLDELPELTGENYEPLFDKG